MKKILILLSSDYSKLNYHEVLNHYEHEVTYIGRKKHLQKIPKKLKAKTLGLENNIEFEKACFEKLKEKKVVFYKTEWEKYEQSPCINIITSLLEFEDNRINVDICLKDAWFNDISV